jgi:glycosyltransferase involved in cell wall biosynthesis
LQALHVIAGLDPAHGGPSYSVPRLCAELAALGAQVRLFHVEGAGEPADAASYELRGFPQDWAGMPVLGALRLSSGLSRTLAEAARTADVVHNHGIWLAPNMRSQQLARRAGKPFICSPRGMLSTEALAFSGARKRLVWALGQRAALEGAACLHATSELELGDIRSRGLTPPVAIIPNGIDIPPPAPRPARERPRTVLSLGRIHPKKGLDNLLQAWSRIEAALPDWRLRIVGPAEDGHDRELVALARGLGLGRVTIEGPVYGPGKLALYQGAELFVAPTRSENFGLTIAEALAAGIPAICTKGAPWAELERERCGWWVEQGPDALAAALGEALDLPPDALAAMGERGRDLVTRRYGWRRVGEDMLQLYAWLAAGGEPPAFVHVG